MPTVDDQLASSSVPVAYLAEMHFDSGVLRLSTWNTDLSWDGNTWVGLAGLCGVSKVQSADRPQYPALDLSLSVGNADVITHARGNVQNYRGRPVYLYRMVMDDEHQPIDDPELVWAGEMSQVLIDSGDGMKNTPSITLRCEQRGRSQRNSSSLRLTSAQHEARFPGDTALRRKEALIAKPQVWLSKKFQQI